MYVLTNRLVNLRGDSLPLPWYHRPPLGLMSGTPVHVALQAPVKRPLGDLIVSIIDPANWPLVSQISAWRSDAPGVIADVYQLAPPLNIVFAEAVTVDSGSRHDTHLVLEPYHPRPDEDVAGMADEEIARITASLLNMGFVDAESRRLHPADTELAWLGVGRIDLGWVHAKGWREAVAEQAGDASADYDLEMAVVSTDTDRRILRFVFPRRGAVTISVEHADKPGAMAVIAGALAGENFNILSSLLRRGSAQTYNAELVAVVEPTDPAISADDMGRRIDLALGKLPRWLRIGVRVLESVDPEEAVLYPRRPHEIAVRPSRSLEGAILAVRGDLPDGKRPIFISRRFVDPDDQYNRDVVEELRKVLDDHGFVAVEGTPQHGSERATSDEVKAKMWASEAAIVLVLETPDARVFSENLAHELGFMQGQGKRLLPLVQEDVSASITRNANLQGLVLSTFSKEHAINRRRQNSIHATVSGWLKTL